jgi:hypothetical protein
MDPILQEFLQDLTRIRRLLTLIDNVGKFSATDAPNWADPDEHLDFGRHALDVHSEVQGCLQDLSILTGTLILYVVGRFESFVRTKFEDMCDKIGSASASYDALPRVMRVNLIKMTAEYITEDRRLNHTGREVQPYITALAESLSDRTKLLGINSKCLSVTTRNMWAATLEELYERIGAGEIWSEIGQQASVKTHFATGSAEHATSEAKKVLNKLMELRNKIAHPSTSFNWPSIDSVVETIQFLEVIAGAISSISESYAVSIPRTRE